MIMISKQRNTYSDWVAEIGLLSKRTITKQSLHERMNSRTECFIKTVLEHQLSKKTQVIQSEKIKGLLKNFNNVMIDDSTTLHLPDKLATEFPGNVSNGVKKSQAKIHAMFNMTENNFVFFHVHIFSNNDQSLSANVLPYLQKNDLCLRDLGFFTLDTIEMFITDNIKFISRKTYQTKIFNVDTGQEISLLKELRKYNFIDKEVLLGKKRQVKVRIVAIPVPEALANERKRRAKTDRDKRLNHSEEYYELLGYSVYITNVTLKQCCAKDVFNLYKLRWSIEIIFKSWKSGFNIEDLIHHQCTNVIRVKTIIYLMLLYIILFHVVWWQHLEDKFKREYYLQSSTFPPLNAR